MPGLDSEALDFRAASDKSFKAVGGRHALYTLTNA